MPIDRSRHSRSRRSRSCVACRRIRGGQLGQSLALAPYTSSVRPRPYLVYVGDVAEAIAKGHRADGTARHHIQSAVGLASILRGIAQSRRARSWA